MAITWGRIQRCHPLYHHHDEPRREGGTGWQCLSFYRGGAFLATGGYWSSIWISSFIRSKLPLLTSVTRIPRQGCIGKFQGVPLRKRKLLKNVLKARLMSTANLSHVLSPQAVNSVHTSWIFSCGGRHWAHPWGCRVVKNVFSQKKQNSRFLKLETF